VTVACITPAEKEVKVSGRPARYLAAGLGPPLVLLHGTGTNRREWGWALPILARGRSVYAPDLPGFGGDGPANDASPEHSAEFVAGFADALGLGRAAVAGNSFGGLVALRLALSEPARVSALCLADSAGLGREVNPALVAPTAPGVGELTVLWCKSPVGRSSGLSPGHRSSSRTPCAPLERVMDLGRARARHG
jgi:pimeloyl-ACP methyl ester carboxylesterase